MKTYHSILINTLLIVGCSVSDGENISRRAQRDGVGAQPRQPVPIGAPAEPEEDFDWSDEEEIEVIDGQLWQEPSASQVLADLAQACDAGGGKFNFDFQVCTCPAGQAFLGWTERKCQAPVERSSCFETSPEKWSKEQMDDCRMLLTFSQEIKGHPSLSKIYLLFTENAEYNEKTWFASHIHELKNMPLQVADQPLGALHMIIIGDRIYDDERLDDFFAWSDNYSLFGIKEGGWNLFTQTTHIPYGVNPASRFELKEDAPDRYLARDSIPQTASILVHFPAIHKEVIKTRFEPTSQYIATEEACLQYCHLTQVFAERIEGYLIHRVRTYIGGALIKDWIEIRLHEGSFPDGLITLTPSGHVSMMFAFETITKEGEPVIRRRIAYDSTWKPLTNGWQETLHNMTFKTSRAKLELAKRSEDRLSTPTAIICESGFIGWSNQQIGWHNLLLGPYTKSGSIYGWFEAPFTPKENSSLYYSGITILDSFGSYNHRFDQEGANHANTVAQIFLRSAISGALIIPIGAEHCLSELPRWLPTIQRHSNAKVVSLSYALRVRTPKLCANSIDKQYLLQAKDDLLLVAGAGNSARNLDESSEGYCTQDMGTLPNLIRVGSGDLQGRAAHSNYGTRTVDILADGTSPLEPGSRGTSFATPRVSGVAASLAHEFPTLTIQQLKLSILLGAQIPASPLPVISGGVLDSETARRFASLWSQQPSSKAQDLLRQVYGKAEAKRRLTLYRERGLKLKLQSQAGRNL